MRLIYGIAIASFKEQKYDEAQGYFRMILGSNLKNKVALDHLGRIELLKKNYREAIIYFGQSLELEPKNSLILENIAYCYYMVDDYEKSYEYYRKAFEINPISEIKKHMNLAKAASNSRLQPECP